MTASIPRAATADAASSRARLLGLRNLLGKDLLEWRRGRRIWTVAATTSVLLVLTAANSRITAFVRQVFPEAAGGEGFDNVALSLDPLQNILIAVGSQFSTIAVVFATMSLLLSERDKGTLAWTISKPVSRMSVWASKWITGTIMVWLTAVLAPLAITTAVATALYGPADLRVVAVIAVGFVAVVALYTAITLAASIVVPSQAAVTAIGLAALAVPALAGGFVPGVAEVLPTAIDGWLVGFATSGRVTWITPLAWFATILALLLVARQRMTGMDL